MSLFLSVLFFVYITGLLAYAAIGVIRYATAKDSHTENEAKSQTRLYDEEAGRGARMFFTSPLWPLFAFKVLAKMWAEAWK